MRSKLFVPGSRPELFQKALASEADAISIDLEDAVAESRKEEARQHVGRFTSSEAAASGHKVVIVRVNALSTPHFRRDLEAVVRRGLRILNLPKIETPDEVREAVALLENVERANGVARPVALLLTIESPKGLRGAAAIAAANPRVSGLQVGYGDLFEPLGIARYDVANVHAVMHSIRYSAAEAGVFAYDGAWADVSNAAGFQAEAEMARRLGFLGKSCIHPSQIAAANAIFQPGAVEIDEARQVLEAARIAHDNGVGAFMVNGRMVDGPFIERARAMVELAERQDASR